MILEPVPLRPVHISPIRLRPIVLQIAPIRAIDPHSGAPEKVNRMCQKKAKQVRKALLRKYGDLCHWCKRQMKEQHMSIEHLVPLALGGDNSWENLRLAHVRCNMRRGAKMEAP